MSLYACNTAQASGPLVPGPQVTVQPLRGAPVFFVDGAPFFSPCFETYAPEVRFFKEFAAAGTKLYSFNITAGGHPYSGEEVWTAPDAWDFSLIDERVARVLEADPDALIIPRIYMGLPRWWCDAHPQEMQVLHHGVTIYEEPNPNGSVPKGRPFPCVASEKWRGDLEKSLRKTLAHIHSAPYADHIFGYLIAGLDTEEWYHWSSGSNQLSGYSTPMRLAFQRWLADRYETAEALQAAWGRPGLTFGEVRVPSYEERWDKDKRTFRDPATHMNVIDWYSFYNALVPETIDFTARIIKEVTGGSKVTGAFYGFMYAFRGDPEYGHNALEHYLASPNLDFIFVTASYINRDFATGGTFQRGPGRSILLNGKLYYHDNDSMSFVSPEVLEGMNWAPETLEEVLFYHCEITDTAEKSRWIYRRDTGFALANGFYTSFFDLHGGHFSHPTLMDEVGRLNRICEDAVDYDRGSCAEILVVADERSCNYATMQSKMLGELVKSPQWEFMQLGAPLDHILLADLPRIDLTPYKLVIFLNAFDVNQQERDLIKRRVQRGGRHVVWCYAPGYFDGRESGPALMHDLTGMAIVPAESEAFVAPRIALLEGGNAYLQGAAAAGHAVFGSETPCCRLFHVVDDEAVPIGRHEGGEEVVFAMRPQSGWTSIYVETSALPSAVWREMARMAGVHIYNEHDDTFYANRSYLTLHARDKGRRTVSFPGPRDVFDLVTGQYAARNTAAYTVPLERGETLLLRLETPTPSGRG